MAINKLLTAIAILSLIIIDKSLYRVEAGCFVIDEDLHIDILRRLRAKVNQTSMSEVYAVIDSKLRRRVRSNDLSKNMRAVMRLLWVEVEAKLFGEKRHCFGFGTKPLMPEDYDKDITINALLRLHDLERIEKSRLECTLPYTHYLVENSVAVFLPAGCPSDRDNRENLSRAAPVRSRAARGH